MAWATANSMARHPHEPIRSANCASTDAAPAFDSRWVAWAILRAFHGATLSASTAAQIRGSRCWRSRASANNCSPVRVETPSAAANGSGVNAATSGVPSPPRAASSRAQAGQAGVGPGHEPRLGGGRVQHTPLGRGPQLGSASLAFPDLGVGGEVEQPLRVEARNLDQTAVQHRLQHESIQAAGTDISAPESGLTKGCGEVFPRVSSTPLGLRFKPTRCGCALASRLRVRGRGRRPGSFSQSSLALLCVKAGRVGSFGPARVRRRVASRPPRFAPPCVKAGRVGSFATLSAADAIMGP